jgi:hypothetical protein
VNFKISHWFSNKGEMVEPTCELIKILKNKDIVIKVIRLDNSGEKILFEKRCPNIIIWQSLDVL